MLQHVNIKISIYILLIAIVLLTPTNAVHVSAKLHSPSSGLIREIDAVEENDSPIVGILVQEISYHLNSKWPDEYKMYLAASYVKFVEGAGARAIPIWIDKPESYYRDIMSKINGILLPGGATWFNQTDGYADAGQFIYDIAKEMNDRGEYMPIWGTCLGFELITYLSSNRNEHRSDCDSDRQPLPLQFLPNFRNSRLFGNTPDEIIEIFRNEPVTANFHHFCTTPQNFTDFHLDDDWLALSVNDDLNGLTFISTIEHQKYPFYAVQFHPEKNIYEWIRNRNIPHTENAIRVSQYFATFFINECRKSTNSFPGGVEEENSVLIYNYPKTFTALVKSAYEECYLFDHETDYRSPPINNNEIDDGGGASGKAKNNGEAA